MKKFPVPVIIAFALWTLLFIRMLINPTSTVPISQMLIVYLFGAVVFCLFGLTVHLIICLIKKSAVESKKWNDPEEKLKRIKEHNSVCPRCKGKNIEYQLVNEAKPTGCLTYVFYLILALTILGLLIVIPILCRKKNTVNYAVCKDCGHRWKTI